MIIKTRSDKETQQLAEKLAGADLQGMICLFGDLGAGKTTFVRGLARGLKIKSRVQSPTFTYQRVHFGEKNLYHFDLYRLEKADFLILSEITEALEKNDGVVVIEWAQRLEGLLPRGVARTDIYFTYINEEQRKIEII